MQPYVIKQGDYLAALAYRFGFDADTVWNDDKNADLRKLRPDPNILWPTDVLYIPDQIDKDPVTHDLDTGATNDFVSHAPPVNMTILFSDEALAAEDYTIAELPDLTGLATVGGKASFAIPLTLTAFTIVFTDSRTTFVFDVGHMDPINTVAGVAKRLQNLGYLGPLPDEDQIDVNAVRAGVRFFMASQGASPDDADLSDDGKLDDATATRVVAAHGS
jgi:N-acetylmuramoyl-L-alanine amidase